MPSDHIKIPEGGPIVRYAANGTQTAYEYPFPIFASEDLKIYFNGALQYAGYDITDAGNTSGGSVTFDAAPENGTVITLERRVPLERMTDFLEGGDFSAQSINNELDYLTASIQQVNRDIAPSLRYSDHEMPAQTVLPDRVMRANKALGFDGDGNPVAVTLEGSMAPPNFTAYGTGAINRTTTDKFSERVSVKDFGAYGNGLNDDTLSI